MKSEENKIKVDVQRMKHVLRCKSLADLPTEERHIYYAVFGKPVNPFVEELKENGHEIDFEDIFEEEFTVPYECGALITAMQNLGISDKNICSVVTEYLNIREERTACSLYETYENYDFDE